MKSHLELIKFRAKPEEWPVGYAEPEWEHEGFYRILSALDAVPIVILATSDHGWDHVSVSRHDRIPQWLEMQQVKRLFFKDDEWVVQYHPAEDDYVTGRWPGGRSLHVLHLWRPHTLPIPRPPKWMVGANTEQEYKMLMRQKPKEPA